MRLDHIAYRVKNRHKTAQFFVDVFKYKIEQEFPVKLEDGKEAKCLVLTPSEKTCNENVWTIIGQLQIPHVHLQEYHMAPEIFISDSEEDTVIRRWVSNRDDVGGIHHLAYQVESVEKTMQFMKEKGYAEFATEEPLTCPGLVQVFTKPSELTGVIYEFIQREGQGFCKDNVEKLMNSTKDFK